MPVPVLEGNETCTTDSGDGFRTSGASLGEKLAKAVGAIRFIVARRKSLTRQRVIAVATGKAVPVPRLVLVRHASASDDLVAFDASCRKLVLVATGAIDLLLAWDEALSTDRILADYAAETFLMPLPGFVFHLLRAGTKDFAATIATAGELSVVTIATVDFVDLASKLFVHQGYPAPVAEEACFVPVLVLVREILRIDTDDFVALLAAISEDALVALDAVRMLVPEYVTLSRQGFVALPATKVPAVPVLVHRLRVLAIFDGMVVVLRAVDLGDRDLGVLIVALPAFHRLLHFANLALGGRVHYTVYVRHRDSFFLYSLFPFSL